MQMTLLGWTSGDDEGGKNGNAEGPGGVGGGEEREGQGGGGGEEERKEPVAGHFRVVSIQFDNEGNAVRMLGDLLSQNPDLHSSKEFCWLPDVPVRGVGGDSRGSGGSGAAGRDGGEGVCCSASSWLTPLTLQYDTPLNLRRLFGRGSVRKEGQDVGGGASEGGGQYDRSEDGEAGEDEEDEGLGYVSERLLGGQSVCEPPGAHDTHVTPDTHDAALLPVDSRQLVSAVGAAAMSDLQRGDVIELERKGFFIVDVPLHAGSGAEGGTRVENVDCEWDLSRDKNGMEWEGRGVGGEGRGGRMRLISIPSGMVVRRYSAQGDDSSDDYADIVQEEAAEEAHMERYGVAGDAPTRLF